MPARRWRAGARDANGGWLELLVLFRAATARSLGRLSMRRAAVYGSFDREGVGIGGKGWEGVRLEVRSVQLMREVRGEKRSRWHKLRRLQCACKGGVSVGADVGFFLGGTDCVPSGLHIR